VIAWNGSSYALEHLTPTIVRSNIPLNLSSAKRVALDLTLGPAASTVSVKVDGIEVGTQSLPGVVSKGQWLLVGLPYTATTTGPTSVRVDDVIGDLQ
jgi:hypothetical protein